MAKNKVAPFFPDTVYNAKVLAESGRMEEDILGKVGSWKAVGWPKVNSL